MSSKDKKKQTYYDKTWLEHEDFCLWVAEVKNISPQCIDVKSVIRQMDYQIWEFVPLKLISKVPLMKPMQRKLRIFVGAQRHQLVLIH